MVPQQDLREAASDLARGNKKKTKPECLDQVGLYVCKGMNVPPTTILTPLESAPRKKKIGKTRLKYQD